MSARAGEVRAAELGRPVWRAARLWLLLALIVTGGALVVVSFSSTSSAPLDPASATHGGSKALAVLLAERGTRIQATTSIEQAADASAGTTVLLAFPDELSSAQLTQLAAGSRRLVVLDPGTASLAALAPGRERTSVALTGATAPGCSWPGALAAGDVALPDTTSTYSGSGTCYEGAVVVTDKLVLLGSSDLLRNDRLATSNIAALDINAISGNGTVTDLVWLLPGPADAGPGRPSIWELFPPWTQRAFWWLLVVGALLALWRGRRLGPVVAEPLPVIVRAAEIIEGHGRLYRRASARLRSARILREATRARLAVRLGLDRQAGPAQVAAVLGGGAALRVSAALADTEPADDQALLELARELAYLETRAATPASHSTDPVPKDSPVQKASQ